MSEVQATPDAETPPEHNEGELEGIILAATVTVVCVACGAELPGELTEIPDPSASEDEEFCEIDIECATCTEAQTKAGKPLRRIVPVVILSGHQVGVLDDHAELMEWLEKNAPEVLARYVADGEQAE